MLWFCSLINILLFNIALKIMVQTGLQIKVRNGKLLSLFLNKTYVVYTQKNGLNETGVLLNIQNICLN